MVRRLAASFLMLVCLAAAPAVAQETPAPPATPAGECADSELSSDVPALANFHEVIAPLWHDAWPAKDLGLMRELLPRIHGHVESLQKVELPGILRDKEAKWDEGVADCAARAGQLETALAADDEPAALDAAEALHAAFENLVRTVRPRMKELDAYHQELYRAYHYDWPQRDLSALAGRAGDMAARCEALLAAAVPKRHEAKAPLLRERFAALCAATGKLREACAAGAEAGIGAALEATHTAYQACERAFD